jgi:hypothetical protein
VKSILRTVYALLVVISVTCMHVYLTEELDLWVRVILLLPLAWAAMWTYELLTRRKADD